MVAEWRELGVEISPGIWRGIFQRLVPLFQPLVEAPLEACRADRRWLMDETRWAVFVRVEGKGSYRWWEPRFGAPVIKLPIGCPWAKPSAEGNWRKAMPRSYPSNASMFARYAPYFRDLLCR